MANAFAMIYACALHQGGGDYNAAEFAALLARLDSSLDDTPAPEAVVIPNLAEPTRPWWTAYTRERGTT